MVGVVERRQDIAHDADDRLHIETLVFVEVVLKVAPFDKFHRDEGGRTILAVFVDAHNVRMVETACGLGFALEARDLGGGRLRIVGLQHIRAHRLEGDETLDKGVLAPVDDTHGALTEFAFDLVLAELTDIRLFHIAPGRCRRALFEPAW